MTKRHQKRVTIFNSRRFMSLLHELKDLEALNLTRLFTKMFCDVKFWLRYTFSLIESDTSGVVR